MKPKWFIDSFRLRNFKAVRDSGPVKLTPLTVFIGNNGSGKSSLVEGLLTLNDMATVGLDKAMQRWKGFEHIFHKSEQLKSQKTEDPDWDQPMSFELKGRVRGNAFRSRTEIMDNRGFNDLRFRLEDIEVKNEASLIRQDGKTRWGDEPGLQFTAPLSRDSGRQKLLWLSRRPSLC